MWAAENGIVSFAGYPLMVYERLVGVGGDVFAPSSLRGNSVRSRFGREYDCCWHQTGRRAKKHCFASGSMFNDIALSHTPDFAYTFDRAGRFTYVNRALLELWQKPLEEALGKNFFDLQYPAELAERLQRQIQQVIETKLPVRDGTPFTGANGTSGYFEYIFVPVCSADGRVEAVAGTTRDVSESQHAAEALRNSEERLSFALVAGGGVGTWDWNVQEDQVYCDVRFAELFSMDPAVAAAGAPLSAFIAGIHPEDRARVSDRIAAAVQSGEDFSAEFRLLRPDRSIQWIYTARPMPSGWRGQNPFAFPE